jgi:peptidyl-tRNA hydrolase
LKKQIEKSKKVTEVIANVDSDGNYTTSIEVKTLEDKAQRFDCAIHPGMLHLKQFQDIARIVVVLAETLQYTTVVGEETYKMETGRQMAQACHAVSALKLLYIEQAFIHGIESHPMRLIVELMENPITTITLKARDTKELLHINKLAEDKGYLHFLFSDDNPPVYGTTERIPTAIAIGPLIPTQFIGLTDYLPLWKDNL